MPVRTLFASAVVAVAAFGLATPASACAGPVCDTINEVCVIARGGPCVR